MSSVKRIALFLDGTWNTLGDNTNVWRLKSLCETSPEQICYYSQGVGTKAGERVSGGVWGIGIDEEISDAYEWLVEHYEPDAKIFIFGFSRGAFTARSLAGFISECGLLRCGSPVSLSVMYSHYRKGKVSRSIRQLDKVPENELSFEERQIKKYSQPIPVWFQGVWDTVGALGVRIPYFPKVSSKDFAFLETDLRINDTRAYHALAIDEHRKTFEPTLWKSVINKQGDSYAPRAIDNVEQRWFVGAHSNVGGGYPNDLLAQIPLRWLMSKAIAHGLQFKTPVEVDGDANRSPIRDSFGEMLHGFYRLTRFGIPYYRPIGTKPVETAVDVTSFINETIDRSVFDRWRADSTYRPQNLLDWSSTYQVDPSSISTSVRADDPSVTLPD